MDYPDLVNDLAEADTFGAGKNGFTEGVTGSVPRTLIRPAGFLNPVLRELLATIEGAGLTPSSASNVQLLAAVKALSDQHVAMASIATGLTFTNAAYAAWTLDLESPNTFSLANSDTEIVLPVVGTYKIDFTGAFRAASASNPLSAEVHLVCGAAAAIMTAVRYSATTTLEFTVTGSLVVSVTNLATQRVKLLNSTGVDLNTSSVIGDRRVVVTRIRY